MICAGKATLHVPSACAVESAVLLTHILCRTQRETRRHERHAHGRGGALRDFFGAAVLKSPPTCAHHEKQSQSRIHI